MASTSPSALIWQRFRRRPSAVFGLVVIVLASFLALLAPYLAYDTTPNADDQQPTISLQPPGFTTEVLRLPRIRKHISTPITHFLNGSYPHTVDVPYAEVISESDSLLTVRDHFGQPKTYDNALIANRGKVTYWLGTDRYGRSISSRIIWGIRISLAVGFIAVGISLSLGILLGLVSGYFGGWVDRLVMYLINVTWSIPTLLLVFAIVLAFGRGIGIIFVAVGLTMWVEVARIVRGQVIQAREAQYVVAARSMGLGHATVMFRHILPNIVGPILVVAAANFATAILIEAGLSYLGFGINPPAPSIGNMLNDHYGYAVSGKLFLAMVPAVVIMLLVLAFNLIGAGLRDAFDVRS